MVRFPLYRHGQVVAETLVDEADVANLSRWRWRLVEFPGRWRTRRYAMRTTGSAATGNKKLVYMHRVLMGLPPGIVPEVDHADGDGLNNQRANLRVVTRAQNAQNRRPNFNSISGRRGVRLHCKECHHSKPWRAYGTLNGVWHHLGYFAELDEAAAVARAWRVANTNSSF